MKPLIGLFFILFAGCASPPQQYDFKKDFLLPDVDQDAAWSAIVGLFAEKNWTITTMEKDSGIIVSDWLGLTDKDGKQFADCGTTKWFVAAKGRTAKFNLFLHKPEQGLQLVINTNFRELREEITAEGPNKRY
ncbi:MAG: hypothetical protein OXI72_23960 [Gemmatimonadota bacterium]|nr:hypothetical protein [Gemmatimonadota bacterium]